MRLFVFLTGAIFFSAVAHSAPEHPQSFSKAKVIARDIYQQKPIIEGQYKSFYCECTFDWKDGKKGIPDLKTCGYQSRNPKKPNPRANRIEWEHIVPASIYGDDLPCWKNNGGRENCSKKSPNFRRMESDLHNLVPVIGEVNGDRGNFHFIDPKDLNKTSKHHLRYGRCEMAVNFKYEQSAPPKVTRGAIARTYLYMLDKYHFKFDNAAEEKRVMAQINQWNDPKTYPVTRWECERDRRIAKVQGNHNPFVLEACKKAAL